MIRISAEILAGNSVFCYLREEQKNVSHGGHRVHREYNSLRAGFSILFLCVLSALWAAFDYRGQLKSVILPLPTLVEQKKIADFLSSLDEQISAQAQKIEALKVHKKGLMQGLFPTGEKE